MNPRRNRFLPRLEHLEGRLAPATMVSATRLTYQDTDGDSVTVTFSRPILTAGNVNALFTFDSGANAVNGSNAAREQLQKLSLAGVAGAAGTAITTSAVRSKVSGGDGFAALGEVDASGLDLGAVVIDGDLGRVQAGDATTTTSGLKGLTALSVGRYGTSTGAPDLNSVIQGKLDFLKVKTDVKDASIDAQGGLDGKLGPVTIGGSLLGGNIGASAAIGSVKIGGDIQGGGGGGSGSITSGGTLAGLTLGGSLIGGSGDWSGSLRISGNVGVVKIGGDVRGGSATGSADLRQSGYVRARRIASLAVGGALVAGVDDTSAAFQNNGAIRVADDIGSATLGSLVGNSTNPAVISARGSLTPTATKDVAIGKLTVKGRVEYAQILAGVHAEIDGSVAADNADAQVGPVSVGGDWVASSLAAGVAPGDDGFFGDGDANEGKISGAFVKDVATVSSMIASLTVGGQVLGTVGGVDFFALMAENVAALKVGGTTIPLAAGAHNDDVFLGLTGDFKVKEVVQPPTVTLIDVTANPSPAAPTSTLTATPSGTNPSGQGTLSFKYQWFQNNNAIPGMTSETLDLTQITAGNGIVAAATGQSYTVRVTPTNGVVDGSPMNSTPVVLG